MNYADIYDDTSKKRLSSRNIKLFLNKHKNKLFLGAIIFYLILHVLTGNFETIDTELVKAKADKEKTMDFKTIGKDLYKQNAISIGDFTLRERMAYYFPYEPEKPLPRNVWQTWKCSDDDPSFPSSYRVPHKSWKLVNPKSDVLLVPDSHVDEFISDTFQEIPEIVTTFRTLPKNILKADFFRYLVVFARGGTYSDLDTICLKPIDTWAPFNEQHVKRTFNAKQKYAFDPQLMISPVGLTIGIEADPDRSDWADWYARRIQFCQWTIQGKRGHPMLRELIVRIVEETDRKKRMGKLTSIEGKDKGGDIMQWTGPGIFTDTVFDYLNNVATNGEAGDGFGVGSKYWLQNKKYKVKNPETGGNNEPLNADKQKINWKTFANLEEPTMIDDVMVLPITGFSPGVGQMGSGSVKDPLAYVKHLFGGTWKPEDERMQK
ncbi:DEKNAAC100708 [Brettanomyces naardenensis]|uniref:DEKNAAC100708 n=1 Tax=Brettanomyces naardenensis TaxID=13370 RepID=A0A448YFC2_BRENA|nr:DEKNAAC100708 [Brettanomyces naardenensis]